MASKDKARHRREGRAVTFAWPTGRGRHRLRQPSTGLIAVSAVVLAASTASSTVQAAPAAPPRPAPLADGSADGGTVPRAVFPQVETHLASGRVIGVGVPPTATGLIPSTVLAAYQRAAERTNLVQPNCHIPLELLAAIGKVESGHARGGRVDAHGTAVPPILGPVLNGGPFAAIHDTDNGSYDGDTSWDRAVGPMQFIPGTWSRWGSDGDNDGQLDPQNMYDASLAAARYLCAANRDLGTPAGLDEAILSYNHSTSYLSLVRSWLEIYRNGTVSVDTIMDPGMDPVVPVVNTPAPPSSPSEPSLPPTTPPVTSPIPVQVTPSMPPSTPSTDPPPPPSTTDPTPPPVEEPPAPEPPAAEPPDQCGLVETVGGIVGGLLGENPECVQSLELSTPETTVAPTP